MSDDHGARWEGDKDQGMQKIVNPLVTGVRMSLRPEKYDKNLKKPSLQSHQAAWT